MKTTFHRIITSDNLELVGLLYEPDIKTGKILVHVHGMAGNFYENKFLDSIAQTLTNKGVTFFAFNNRGCEYIKDLTKFENSDKKIVRFGTAYEIFEGSAIDIKASIDFAEQQGFSEIHLSGHSLGAPKIVYYFSSTKDSRLASLIALSPSDMLGLVRANKGRFEQDIKEANEMVASGNGNNFISNMVWDEYPISANAYLSLFADDSKASVFNFYNPEDKLETLGSVTCPLLAIAGRKDDALTVSVEETMDRISKASINSPKAETKILGDADHGYNNFEQQLADEIISWIQKI